MEPRRYVDSRTGKTYVEVPLPTLADEPTNVEEKADLAHRPLDERQRRIAEMVIDGWKKAEIARELGVDPAVITRALPKLRKILRDLQDVAPSQNVTPSRDGPPAPRPRHRRRRFGRAERFVRWWLRATAAAVHDATVRAYLSEFDRFSLRVIPRLKASQKRATRPATRKRIRRQLYSAWAGRGQLKRTIDYLLSHERRVVQSVRPAAAP